MKEMGFPKTLTNYGGFDLNEVVKTDISRHPCKIINIIQSVDGTISFVLLYRDESVGNEKYARLCKIPKEPKYVPFADNEMPNLKLGDVVRNFSGKCEYVVIGIDKKGNIADHIFFGKSWMTNDQLWNEWEKVVGDKTERLGKIKEEKCSK